MSNLPRHQFWGAGEPNCPPDLKAPNGELHTMRCKVCGDGWRALSGLCIEALIGSIRELPFVSAPEIDGEESDGTPRHYRSRRYVSLTKLERLLRGTSDEPASPSTPGSNTGR